MGINKEPIRILQYIGSLETGGSQAMIMNIYRSIDRNKVQFDFVVDRKEGLFYKDEIKSLGGKVYVFDEYFKGYNYIGFTKQWKDFFKKHPEYKIIHCHVRSVASIVLKIAKKNGLKTICHSHSTSNGKGMKAVVKKVLQNKIHKYCDYYFACSEESAKWLYGDEILKDKNCVILKNAIDVDKYAFNKKVRDDIRKALNLEDKIVLGQVGRLEKVKNHVFSLELLNKMLEKDSKYFLLIVGTGSLKDSIAKKAESLGVSGNIMILENRNDIPELLQAMDVFIMPSLYEGLPLSLVEAQAAGLSCVISDNVKDGIIVKEIVKKVNLEEMEKWVKNIKQDASLARRNSEDYILKIKDAGFDVTNNVDMLCDFYCEVSTQEKMKMMFCLGSMKHGGAERVVANLANYFVERNEVSIVITKPCRVEYNLDEKVELLSLDGKGSKKGLLVRTFKRTKKLRKILKDGDFDLAISFLPEPSFRLMLAKRFLSVRTIISVRNDPNKEYDNFIKKLLVKILYTRADGFVFQTPDAKKWFSEKIQAKSVVIPNPVDEEFLCKPYDGEREKKIVNVGRLVEQKNQELLIDAFCDFHNSHEDYVLEIYGEGPLRTRLQARIDDLGLSKVVKLKGEVANIKEEIYKAKMFVLSSDYEGMPNALMEAMALGLPCISTDCPIGGPKYLIRDGVDGILAGINNKDEIAAGMTKVVDDEDFAIRMGISANRRISSDFNVETINLKWNQFMMGVI